MSRETKSRENPNKRLTKHSNISTLSLASDSSLNNHTSSQDNTSFDKEKSVRFESISLTDSRIYDKIQSLDNLSRSICSIEGSSSASDIDNMNESGKLKFDNNPELDLRPQLENPHLDTPGKKKNKTQSSHSNKINSNPSDIQPRIDENASSLKLDPLLKIDANEVLDSAHLNFDLNQEFDILYNELLHSNASFEAKEGGLSARCGHFVTSFEDSLSLETQAVSEGNPFYSNRDSLNLTSSDNRNDNLIQSEEYPSGGIYYHSTDDSSDSSSKLFNNISNTEVVHTNSNEILSDSKPIHSSVPIVLGCFGESLTPSNQPQIDSTNKSKLDPAFQQLQGFQEVSPMAPFSSIGSTSGSCTKERNKSQGVEADLLNWDGILSHHDWNLIIENARKTTPNELIDLPKDHVGIVYNHSEYFYYPPLEEGVPTYISDSYEFFTGDSIMIAFKNELYGPTASQRDRIKEHAKMIQRANLNHTQIPHSSKTNKSSSQMDISHRKKYYENTTSTGVHSTQSTTPSLVQSSHVERNLDPPAPVGDDSLKSPNGLPYTATMRDSSSLRTTVNNGSKMGKKKQTSLGAIASDLDDLPMDSNMDSNAPQKLKSNTLTSRTRSTFRKVEHLELDRLQEISNQGHLSDSATSINPNLLSLKKSIVRPDHYNQQKDLNKIRQSIKGVFETFVPSLISSHPLHEKAECISLRNGPNYTRAFFTVKPLKMSNFLQEAFFCTAALYDINKRKRISENFYFDSNATDELVHSLLSLHGIYDNNSSWSFKRFVVNIFQPSPYIYLIVRVKTNMRNDIDSIADLHSGNSISTKDRQRCVDQNRQALSLFGKYQQNLGWAAIQLFDENLNFKLESISVPIYKIKLHSNDMAIMDALHSEELRKMKTIDIFLQLSASIYTPATFQLHKFYGTSYILYPEDSLISPFNLSKNADDKAEVILKHLVKPPKEISDPVLEVEAFLPPSTCLVHSHFINNLYIFPISLNIQTSKIRNKFLTMQVYFMKSDQGTFNENIIPNQIYAQTGELRFITSVILPINWDSVLTFISDEIKLKLPPNLAEDHHLLFLFFNINSRALTKKRDDKYLYDSESVCGYSYLPLFQNQLIVKDGEHSLSIFPINNTDGLSNYIRDPLVSNFDREKVVLTVHTNLVSTVLTQDVNLNQYFLQIDTPVSPSKSPKKTDHSKEAKNASAASNLSWEQKKISYIYKTKPSCLYPFFPVVLNQLIKKLSTSKNKSVQLHVFRAIVYVISCVSNISMISDSSMVSQVLYSYVTLYFNPQGHIKNPAKAIILNWVSFLSHSALQFSPDLSISLDSSLTPREIVSPRTPVGNPTSTNVFASNCPTNSGTTASIPAIPSAVGSGSAHVGTSNNNTSREVDSTFQLATTSLKDVSWILFALISKSLTIEILSKNQSNIMPSDILRNGFTTLIDLIFRFYNHVNFSFNLLNRYLAYTFCQLFSVLDRSFVCQLIYQYIYNLKRHDALSVCRQRFLQIITDYEHFIPLNAPSYTKVDSLDVMHIKFWKEHYLAGLFLEDLKSTVISSNESSVVQSNALLKFRDLLWKHHMDVRYQSNDCRSRITGIYFPLWTMVVENSSAWLERMSTLRAPKKGNASNEPLDWCLCISWILTYSNRDLHLRPWMRNESSTNLVNAFSILKAINECFQSEEVIRNDFLYMQLEFYHFVMKDLYGLLIAPGSKLFETFLHSIIYVFRSLTQEKVTLLFFQMLRDFIVTFRKPLFCYVENYSTYSEIVYEVINFCQSQPKSVMTSAISIFYLMLRTNNDEVGHFSRMKLNAMSSVSRLVTSQRCNNIELQNSLESMASYESPKGNLSWNSQIREFVFQNIRIINDNLSISLIPHDFDSDLKAELYYQISQNYLHAPDLRITWIDELAQLHQSCGKDVEAACCKVHICFLIAEYLKQVISLKQPIKGLPSGSKTWNRVIPSISEEKGLSLIWLEGNTILSPDFSEDGFIKYLTNAIELFHRTLYHELAVECQVILLNYYNENRRWEMLVPLANQISLYSQTLYESNRSQRRIQPNYYRVGFYGDGFGRDSGNEYIYRENPDVRLTDFTTKMQQRYLGLFQNQRLEILKNKPIEELELDMTKKNYLQIVSCDIYSPYEEQTARDLQTFIDGCFDVKKFCFEMPYSPDGAKPSEEVSKSWKRKIILTTIKSFPYILSRLIVVQKESKILTPIESAVDLILMIVSRFKQALNCVPPNTKTVQIMLQGSVLTQVNAGPLAIIREFLGNATQYSESEVRKLGTQIKSFVRLCQFGLRLNATLIEKEPELAPLHQEMMKAFAILRAEASKHLDI